MKKKNNFGVGSRVRIGKNDSLNAGIPEGTVLRILEVGEDSLMVDHNGFPKAVKKSEIKRYRGERKGLSLKRKVNNEGKRFWKITTVRVVLATEKEVTLKSKRSMEMNPDLIVTQEKL